ncbi:MAG: hypothetical protein O9306_09130 [Beijerinckiaceae bacterium]|nr:hypothetical protein [Beijerinckiaceae bacterium]
MDGSSFAGIKAAYDALQGLIKIRDWTQNADAKLAVANALSGLADAKNQITELKAENQKLRDELTHRKQVRAAIKKLKSVGQVLKSADQLFKCRFCAEKDEKVLTLYAMEDNSRKLKCMQCEGLFDNPDFDQAKADAKAREVSEQWRQAGARANRIVI